MHTHHADQPCTPQNRRDLIHENHKTTAIVIPWVSPREHAMSPVLLLGLVILVLGLGAVVKWTDRHPPHRLSSAQHAQDRFLADYPRAQISTCDITTDHSTALLALEDGRLGIVLVVGHHEVTRLFQAANLHSITAQSHQLHIQTRDVTMPSLTVNLDATVHQQWHAYIDALMGKEHHHAS